MIKIKEILRKPIFWTYLIVIYISLGIIMKVFASLGPPFIYMQIANVDEKVTIEEIIEAVHLYSQEGAKNLEINQNIIENSIVFNVLIAIPALVISFFVLRKKVWARKLFIFILVILILQPVIVDLYNLKSIIRIINLNTIPYLVMIWFFQRKSTLDVFIKDI